MHHGSLWLLAHVWCNHLDRNLHFRVVSRSRMLLCDIACERVLSQPLCSPLPLVVVHVECIRTDSKTRLFITYFTIYTEIRSMRQCRNVTSTVFTLPYNTKDSADAQCTEFIFPASGGCLPSPELTVDLSRAKWPNRLAPSSAVTDRVNR